MIQRSLDFFLVRKVCDANNVNQNLHLKRKRVDTNAFLCNFCQAMFLDSQSCVEHQRIFHESTKYTCDVCRAFFDDSCLFEQHKQRCLLIGSASRCLHCDAIFANENLRDEHMTSNHLFTCEDCQETFSDITLFLSHHKQQKHGFLKCKQCAAFFETSFLLAYHVETVHEILECPQCSVFCRNETKWAEHMRLHCITRELKLKIGEDARTMQVLMNRVNSTLTEISAEEETGEVKDETKTILAKPGVRVTKHACTYCSKHFNSKSNLKRHVDKQHEHSAPSYPCNHCGAVLSTKTVLAHHLERHETNMKFNYPCDMQDGGTQVYAPGDLQCSIRCETQAHLEYHKRQNHTLDGLGKNYRSELKLADFFTQHGIAFTRDWENRIDFKHCKTLQNALTNSARPDFYLLQKSIELQCVFLVCNDEFAHRRTRCEFQRMFHIASALELTPGFAGRPIVFVRFNPDAFVIDQKRIKYSLDVAHQKLLACIQSLKQSDLKDGVNLIFIHYDITNGKLDVFGDSQQDELHQVYEKSVLRIIN